MSAPAHVVIVGAGIAGASAAHFAATRGLRITLIDAARERASDVPVALVNPVRGSAGKVVEGGFAAARFSFALVDALIERGYRIAHGRGLVRPVPDADTRSRWQRQLPAGEAWRWIGIDAGFNLLGGWHSALYLPEAGWIETRPLLDALIDASGCTVLRATVTRLEPEHRRLWLDDGCSVNYQQLLWCGGALGAAITAGSAPALASAAKAHKFRPGSVLTLARPLGALGLSYGIYAAPWGSMGVVGSTSEPPSDGYACEPNAAALARLERRVAATFLEVGATTGSFRGVRFERLQQAPGIATLDGFGARGYLLAPRAAAAWAAEQVA